MPAMDAELLQQHWGPFVAAALLIIVTILVGVNLWRRSRAGQLRLRLRGLRKWLRERDSALRRVRRAERRFEYLSARHANVRPRRLQEAEDELKDARALLQIAQDQVLVAANHVRRVIVEEYPPTRHERLRRRYLPDEPAGGPSSSSRGQRA